MQRGTRQSTTTSSNVTREDTVSTRSNSVRFGGLESPGDSSPPGIQFTRGSFSEHLLPLDSPSSTRDDSRSRVASTSTPTQSLLRSPTRKRPPPAPSAAPRPPTNITRKPATASSILMPSPPSSGHTKPPRPPPPTPTQRGKKEARSVVCAPSPTEPPQLPVTTLDLSVNPIDALVKKLRQQASELTQVYEQMEKKDADLDNLRREVKQLHMQTELQRPKRTSLIQRSITKKTSASTQLRPANPTSGVPQVGFTQSQGASLSPAKQCTKDPAIAMCRIEEALAELRQCHRELLGNCSSATTGKEALTPADIQQEQQLYIRVLEEAVHLKASELCITGHEELLVVLAELRHTIYQQEQEIGELNHQLNQLKSEHLECKTVRLEIEGKLQKQKSEFEQESVASRQREVALQRQLEDVQRLAHTEHMRFREERVTQDEQTKRIASLEQELRERTQELRQWETVCSDKWAKKESMMVKQIEDLKGSLEAERAELARTNDTLEKSQHQVEELRAMQEGLLQSIDQFVSKEDQYEQRTKQLEAKVDSVEQLRRDNESLHSSNMRLHEELEDTKRKNTEYEAVVTAFEAIKQANDVIQETTEKKSAKDPGTSDERVQFAALDMWIKTLQQVLPSISASQPWLSTFVGELLIWSTHVHTVLDEYEQLAQCKMQLEQSLEGRSSELKHLQRDLLQCKTELIQSQLESEKLQLRVSAMDEEILEAQAHRHLREKLAEQIFEQENLLRTQQQRLHNALEQNNELMALETDLAMQLAVKEQEIHQLRGRVQDCSQLQLVLRELEHELEEAADLAERQNSWNQQLTVEFEHAELAKAEQDQLVETLEMREEAFVTRFTALFSQYVQFVAVNKQRLKDECAITGNHRDNQDVSSRASIHDEALNSGDMLQMLRVFPTLIEEYLAGIMLGVQGGKQSDQRKSATRTKQRAQAPLRLVDKDSNNKKERIKKPDNIVDIEQDYLEEPLGVQLREIANAFSRFKVL